MEGPFSWPRASKNVLLQNMESANAVLYKTVEITVDIDIDFNFLTPISTDSDSSAIVTLFVCHERIM